MKHHSRESRGRRFLDGVLDQRTIHDRQHLLRTRFCRRQEAGAEACDGKYRMADRESRGIGMR